jgi:hypothetical protein
VIITFVTLVGIFTCLFLAQKESWGENTHASRSFVSLPSFEFGGIVGLCVVRGNATFITYCTLLVLSSETFATYILQVIRALSGCVFLEFFAGDLGCDSTVATKPPGNPRKPSLFLRHSSDIGRGPPAPWSLAPLYSVNTPSTGRANRCQTLVRFFHYPPSIQNNK